MTLTGNNAETFSFGNNERKRKSDLTYPADENFRRSEDSVAGWREPSLSDQRQCQQFSITQSINQDALKNKIKKNKKTLLLQLILNHFDRCCCASLLHKR